MVEFVKAQGNAINADGLFDKVIMMRDWHDIWLAFATYALMIAVAFAILFKHKHNPEEVAKVSH